MDPNDLSALYGAVTRSPDGQPLAWPGGPTGFPVIGLTPDERVPLSREQYENLPIRAVYRCRWFAMDRPQEAAAYAEIRSRIANAWYVERHCDRHVSTESGVPQIRIWLEWCEYYHARPAWEGPPSLLGVLDDDLLRTGTCDDADEADDADDEAFRVGA